MSLHELYRMSKGKVDHKEMNNTGAADQPSTHKNDLLELVWENGQVSMQGQSSSSRAKKSPTFKSLPSHCIPPCHSPKGEDKDSGYANETNTRMGKFGDLDTIGLNEITRPVASGEVGLSQEEDMMMMIPWLNYIHGMDDSLQHEYSSGFLQELCGVTMNELPASYKFSLLDRRGSSDCNQVFRDPLKNYSGHVLSSEQGILSKGGSAVAEEVENSGLKASTSQLYKPSLLHQCQPPFASIRSRELDIAENNTSNAAQHAPCGEISQMERQDPNMSSSSSTIMNFTHFAKPVAIVKANLQNIGLSCSRSESVGIKNKGEAPATGSNPPESTKVDLSGECAKKPTIHSQQAMEPSKVDLKPLEARSLEQDAAVSTPTCNEDVSKVDQTSNQVLDESGRKDQEAVEKCIEPMVVSSSVCSGNGTERDSDDPNKNLKRRGPDTEDSECHSEDVEDESVGVKRAAHSRGGMGSKRHRSAEVHNLSERRRRDRINEKMRALQELVPNCNKADKASMLDEAIEYLKTLQLQLQIMSMGGGLYMPVMMLPAGMQHMHAGHMSPVSPMGVGMQMGLGVGYGMRMPGINDGSSRFPMVQMPQLQGTHLSVAHTSGPAALHGMARSNPQMFGLHGQGIPMHMPCAPMFSFPGESLMNPSAAGLNSCGTAGLVETVESASAPKFKDPMPNVSQVMQNSNGIAFNSASDVSTQCGATTGSFEQSTLVLDSDHSSLANDRGAANPSKEDNIVIGHD